MKMKAKLLLLLNLIFLTTSLNAQSTINLDCKDIFLSGANLAWVNFGRDFGYFDFDNPSKVNPPDLSAYSYYFSQIKEAGGNSVRFWVHVDAAFTPEIDATGYVPGLSMAMTNDEIVDQMRHVLDLAWESKLYVNFCLFSFDLLSTTDDQPKSSISLEANKNFLESPANIQSYIDNALTPIVLGLKDHPALMNWEIFNEMEGMSLEFGWEHEKVSMSALQIAVNKISGAIHDLDPDALVTSSSWSILSVTDVDTGFDYNKDLQKNYYSDAELIAAGGVQNGTLDYYQVHYYNNYNWPDGTSVFLNPASHWGLDKPIMLGEFHANADYVKAALVAQGYPEDGAYKYLYDKGYFGGWGWQWYKNWLKPDIEKSITYMHTNFPNLVKINEVNCPENNLDDDHDGVTNDLDLCPETPLGETVDGNGCSTNELLDGDSDGVINGQDKCPNTSDGESVDVNGCSTNELLDDDNDGVFNGIDLCVSTPFNEDVDAFGCSSSQLDDDNDGVVNYRDYCEHTPEGATVNYNGCTDEQVYNDLHNENYVIRYNQLTYLVDRDKMITFISYKDFKPIDYTIFNELNEEVMSGETGTNTFWYDAYRFVFTLDVSSLNLEGEYRLVTSEKEISFKIRKNKYSELAEASLKYFYYNRASMEIEPQYSGHYSRAAGHMDTEVVVHSSAASVTRPEGTIISSSKGWYDAGDYNKYIVNSGISTFTLLAAYEHYKDYYDALELNIPEQGGDLPDILDEVLWNLDWMLTMQDPGDGGVYHKLAGDSTWRGFFMPVDDDYGGTRYVVMKTTSAALNFAAVTATASRIFADFESVKPGFSALLLQASQSAFTWAKNNPTVYFAAQNVFGVGGGNYGDGRVTDEFSWAAAELYITTLDPVYITDIDTSTIYGFPQWQNTSNLAGISLSHHAENVAGGIDIATVESKMIAAANLFKNSVNNSAERMAPVSGQWGSNGDMSNQILMMIRAYEITKDASYLQASYTALDYLFGRNGTGYSYVTGYGDKTPLYPQHRPSHMDIVTLPIPGMLVGGPNSRQQDKSNCPEYPNNYRASSYLDLVCSYASNEVAINWNAPFAYIINALQYYQSEVYPDKSDPFLDDDQDGVVNSIDLCQNTPLGQLVDDIGCSQSQLSVEDEQLKQGITFYPNPVSNKLTIESELPLIKVEIFSVLGVKMIEVSSNFEAISVESLSKGIYVVRVFSEESSTVIKMIKE